MISSLKHFIRERPILRAVIYEPYRWSYPYWGYYLTRYWRRRLRDVLACPDNAYIPRVRHAGRTKGQYQIMHNGLLVRREGYCGYALMKMLERNRGVHEPQQERVFGTVLSRLPSKACMIELGAYWGFYSMWFHQSVAEPSCYLIEPKPAHLDVGRKNFQHNRMIGHFTRALVGSTSGRGTSGDRRICVDDFVRENRIERVHVLHSDIEGAELDMLQGAGRTLADRKVDYLFLSTHSDALHEGCLRVLDRHGYHVMAAATCAESFSCDGLIVAGAKVTDGLEKIDIARKNRLTD